MSFRTERVRELIKQEISKIIQKDIKDPRIGFVTVTDTEISSDLRYARTFISVYGNEKQKKSTMIGLERAVGYIRKEIGKRIRLKFTPEIKFEIDETIEKADKLSRLFSEIEKQTPP